MSGVCFCCSTFKHKSRFKVRFRVKVKVRVRFRVNYRDTWRHLCRFTSGTFYIVKIANLSLSDAYDQIADLPLAPTIEILITLVEQIEYFHIL